MELDDLRARLLAGFDVDQEAYEGILRAFRLPKQTEIEQAARRAAIADATRHATLVPLENARLCVRVLELCGVVVATGLPQAITDAGVGAAVAFAGAQGALYNVLVNLAGAGRRWPSPPPRGPRRQRSPMPPKRRVPTRTRPCVLLSAS